MRILIVADSHHDLAGLVLALKKFAANVDIIVHLGDGVEDLAPAARAARVSLPDVKAVRGNGDADSALPPRLVIEIEGGAKALLLHGHYEGVGDGLDHALLAARSSEAGLLFFAHTHKPFFEEYRGVLAVNPGSISRPRGRTLPTFAVVDAPSNPDRWYDVRFYEVGRGFGGVKEIELV
jgi:putative phosphoesterase